VPRQADVEPIAHDRPPVAIVVKLMQVREPGERPMDKLLAEPVRRLINEMAKS
jgi:hypothetical protein